MQFVSSFFFLMYSDKAYVAGLNQETISDDLPMKNDDLEDLLDKKSDDLSENGRELEQPFKVLDESDIVLVSEERAVGLTPEMGEDVDDEVSDVNKGKLFSFCTVRNYGVQSQNK